MHPTTQPAAAATEALLRKSTVLSVTGLTDRGLQRRIAAGLFPKPLLLDARNPAWLASEVQAWIDQLKADRDNGIKSPERLAYEEARRRGGVTSQARRRAAQHA